MRAWGNRRVPFYDNRPLRAIMKRRSVSPNWSAIRNWGDRARICGDCTIGIFGLSNQFPSERGVGSGQDLSGGTIEERAGGELSSFGETSVLHRACPTTFFLGRGGGGGAFGLYLRSNWFLCREERAQWERSNFEKTIYSLTVMIAVHACQQTFKARSKTTEQGDIGAKTLSSSIGGRRKQRTHWKNVIAKTSCT